jgi:putative pyruvate formate lyase activating enzyme
MRCVYCERWEVSQKRHGWEMSASQLAGVMLRLQEQGCHNINFIGSGHMVMQLLAAVLAAASKGLHVPLVYQSCGYDSVEALRLLEGVVDIYAPAMKFGDSENARRLSGVEDYVQANQAAVREMYRQVGDLKVDGEGIARRGLIVRHLVLPDGTANSDRVLSFVANELSRDTYIDLVGRYHPCYRAAQFPELNHAIDEGEFQAVVDMAHKLGFSRVEQRLHAAMQ